MSSTPYEHIDPNFLYVTAGSDLETFRLLAQTFLKIAPPMFARLETAARESDPLRCAAEAHSLRGATCLLAASRLSDLLGQLEVSCRQSAPEMPPVDLPALRSLFDKVTQEVEICLHHFTGD